MGILQRLDGPFAYMDLTKTSVMPKMRSSFPVQC